MKNIIAKFNALSNLKKSILITTAIFFAVLITLLLLFTLSNINTKKQTNNIILDITPTPTLSLTPTLTLPIAQIFPLTQAYYNSDYQIRLKMPENFTTRNYNQKMDCITGGGFSSDKITCAGKESPEDVEIIKLVFSDKQHGGSVIIRPGNDADVEITCSESENSESRTIKFLSKDYDIKICKSNINGALRSQTSSRIFIHNFNRFNILRFEFTTDDEDSLEIIQKIFASVENIKIETADVIKIKETTFQNFDKKQDTGFVFYDEKFYIRIGDIIYSPAKDKSNKVDINTLPDFLTWIKLESFPPNIIKSEPVGNVHAIYDYKKKIAIVSILYLSENMETQSDNLFINSDQKLVKNLTDILKINKENKKENISIDAASSDIRYLEFNAQSCTYCESSNNHTILYDLNTNNKITLPRLIYFNWLTNGNYEYKEYVYDCSKVTKGTCPSKDPATLPLFTGKI